MNRAPCPTDHGNPGSNIGRNPCAGGDGQLALFRAALHPG